MENPRNPFAGKKIKKSHFEPESGDPLGPLKKGMLMSTYKQEQLSQLKGANKRERSRIYTNSVLGSHVLNPLVSPLSSICESYKNVDFFAVKEPYLILKNKF